MASRDDERPAALPPASSASSAEGGNFRNVLPVPYDSGATSPGRTVHGNAIPRNFRSRGAHRLCAHLQPDFRNWRFATGAGQHPTSGVFDLEELTATNMTDNPANDGHAMWHGRTVYLPADRGPNQRYNIRGRPQPGFEGNSAGHSFGGLRHSFSAQSAHPTWFSRPEDGSTSFRPGKRRDAARRHRSGDGSINPQAAHGQRGQSHSERADFS